MLRSSYIAALTYLGIIIILTTRWWHLSSKDFKMMLSPCLPQHIHISPATNVEETTVSMTLSFTLDYEECGMATARVVYGRVGTPEEEWGDSTERLQFDFQGYDPKKYSSGWIHHARLERLQGGLETYWYRIQVVREDKVASSPTYTFRTPPLPSSPARIALVGDWGGTEDSVQTMQGMLSATHKHPHPLSAVVIAGDLSYANSNLPHWQDWLEKMEPLFRSTPLMVAPGNHEIECDQETFQVFTAYESYFRNPNRLPTELLPSPRREECTNPSEFLVHYHFGNSFYAVTHGMLQILVLNSFTNTTRGSVQYEWLQHELESMDRSVTPWLLVVFHCPLHTTFHGHNNELNPNLMMQDMEPLFVKHHVALVVSGHNHAYVRTYSMIHNKVDISRKGPVYLTVGTGGISHSEGPLNPIPEPWVAHRDHTEFGFGELYAVNATHAHFQRVLNNQRANAEAQDEVWLINPLAQ